MIASKMHFKCQRWMHPWMVHLPSAWLSFRSNIQFEHRAKSYIAMYNGRSIFLGRSHFPLTRFRSSCASEFACLCQIHLCVVIFRDARSPAQEDSHGVGFLLPRAASTLRDAGEQRSFLTVAIVVLFISIHKFPTKPLSV